MAHIVILTHQDDEFSRRRYLLRALAEHWTKTGHRISLVTGTKSPPKGDLAILHVDVSVVPGAYARLAKKYRTVINGGAGDIRKRRVSRNLLGPGDRWRGPVIIKTDLNSGGLPEMRLHRLAVERGQARGDPPVHVVGDYEVLPSLRAVPKEVWSNPGLVVERFLPEKDERGYWLRTWVFFGEAERCIRYLAGDRIVKGANVLDREDAPVPKELWAERERLGFDYGKFDFVLRGGKPILLDANRTPTMSQYTASPAMAEANARLAMGIDTFLK